MTVLVPLRDACTPREDVLAGGLADNHFAAQLDKIVRDPASYPVYGDPDRFFELTHPTSGLKTLISRAFGRLAGSRGDAGEHGVIRAETSFGGGKTHGLIAVYHLAKGARPANLADFVDPTFMPEGAVQVAAVVGDVLDPLNGLSTNGHRSLTLWGEVAAQLGDSAWTAFEKSDRDRTAPGTETIREAFTGRPTIVIVDEIAQHFRQLSQSGNEDVRRSAAQLPVFLKNLFEVAMGDPNVVVVVTLASSRDAYGKETDELAALMDETGVEYRDRLEEAHSVLARSGKVVQPATDNEIGEILKRRLFSSIDTAAARAAGDAYKELYERLGRTENLAGGAEHPHTYAQRVTASYPFHPELVRVLDKRLGDIPNFQRARGALKLLAEVVAGIWENGSDAEVINVADIDYGRDEVLHHLTVGIGRPDFEGIAQADLAGSDSHAAAVDATRFAGRRPYATRACRTVFTHSLEQKAGVGASRNDYLLGTLRADDDPTFVDEALAEAEKVCWHLAYDGMRWRFHTEPNVNKIIEDEKRNVPNSVVSAALDDQVERVFAADAGVTPIHFPNGPADVKDAGTLRVVVVHHDRLKVAGRGVGTPDPQVVEMLDKAGTAGAIRKNRNTVVFVVADADQVDAMKDRVRYELAVNRLAQDNDRLAQFSDEVRKKVFTARDQAGILARVAVTLCYKHVYWPVADRDTGHLRHGVLPAQSQGQAQKPGTRAVVDLLRNEGKVKEDQIAYSWLRSKTWPNAQSTTTAEIHEWFSRDHAAPLLLDVSLLKDAIQKGVRGDGWVYYDTETGKVATSADASPTVVIAPTAQVMTTDEATRQQLLVKDATTADLLKVATKPQQTATDIRAALEQSLGGEPAKGKVLELLATVVGNERYGRLVVVDRTAPGEPRALTPTEIQRHGLDNLDVYTRAEADRIGVTIPGRIAAIRNPQHRGGAGVAFQRVADQLSDLRKAASAVTVTGFAASDTQDIDLLGAALGQLPRQDVTVHVELGFGLPGLTGGVNVELDGDRKAYQSANTKLGPLVKAASDVGGTMRLNIAFTSPTRPGEPEWDTVQGVFRNLAPADVDVTAVIAE